jgi:hypothetical protein
MKQLFYTFLLTITVIACSNGKAEKNKIAIGELAKFPGTAIYIELPKGFAWNETAMGFYRDEDGSVIKYDEFKTMRYAANMRQEETIGTLINHQPIIVSGYKGEIKTYEEWSSHFKLVLSFGDSTFMKFIEASYFTKKEQSGKDVLAALKTIQLRKK